MYQNKKVKTYSPLHNQHSQPKLQNYKTNLNQKDINNIVVVHEIAYYILVFVFILSFCIFKYFYLSKEYMIKRSI